MSLTELYIDPEGAVCPRFKSQPTSEALLPGITPPDDGVSSKLLFLMFKESNMLFVTASLTLFPVMAS
jgi:hypothetical protein